MRCRISVLAYKVDQYECYEPTFPFHIALHSILPLLTCALQSSNSVGIANNDAVNIPKESENPIEPIWNSRSCFARSASTSLRAGIWLMW